jgi:hypothetical protein
MVAAKQIQEKGHLQIIIPPALSYKVSTNPPLMPVNADIATSLAPPS